MSYSMAISIKIYVSYLILYLCPHYTNVIMQFTCFLLSFATWIDATAITDIWRGSTKMNTCAPVGCALFHKDVNELNCPTHSVLWGHYLSLSVSPKLQWSHMFHCNTGFSFHVWCYDKVVIRFWYWWFLYQSLDES